MQGAAGALLHGPVFSALFRRIVPRAACNSRALRVGHSRPRVVGVGRGRQHGCVDSSERGNTADGGNTLHTDHFCINALLPSARKGAIGPNAWVKSSFWPLWLRCRMGTAVAAKLLVCKGSRGGLEDLQSLCWGPVPAQGSASLGCTAVARRVLGTHVSRPVQVVMSEVPWFARLDESPATPTDRPSCCDKRGDLGAFLLMLPAVSLRLVRPLAVTGLPPSSGAAVRSLHDRVAVPFGPRGDRVAVVLVEAGCGAHADHLGAVICR